MRRSIASCALVLLGACKLGPDYVRPQIETPEVFMQPVSQGESFATVGWWHVYEDPALQELIHTALAENQDLRAAAWRVEEARARLGFTRADQFPSFTYQGSASHTNPSNQIRGMSGSSFESYSLGANAFWELDLWGKLRRSTESAQAELLSVEENRRALTLSLVAEVARQYLLLRSFDAQLEISTSTLSSRTASTDVIRARYQQGVVSELDLHQAEVEESTAAAAVPFFERQRALVEHSLSALIGRNPGPIVRGAELVDQRFPLAIPAGLPSELLERRPDVLAAEQALHAQLARIGVAEALRFPSLSLTGSTGIASSDLDDLIDDGSGFGFISLDLLGPLFEFGKNEQRVAIERARSEQLLAAYDKVVRNAFREVEDALVSIDRLRAEYAALMTRVEAARSAVRLARARYDGGVTSYLEVLDIERTLFEAELDASSTLQEQLAAVVDLYAALGGGWTAEEPPAEEPAPEESASTAQQ